MSGRTFDTKRGAVLVNRDGEEIVLTITQKDGPPLADRLSLDDARELAAVLLELVDAPAAKPVDHGHIETRDATPDEQRAAIRALRERKKGEDEPS